MQIAGMDAASSTAHSGTNMRANLAALRAGQPGSAKLIEASAPPFPLELVAGRDGATTFAWNDEIGRRKWLGNSTMPSVSEEALVEQFDTANGNVILDGMGQGTAIRLLADRLRPHQAIFVIETDAWRAAAAFQLHALADTIRRRQLLVFVGRDAWDHLVEHLIEWPGYFVPDRTLAWPWFSRADVRALTERITAMQARVNEGRNSPGASPATRLENQTPRIFIGTNAGDATAHRWARRLEQAARESNAVVFCAAPDDPSMLHPAAIERRIAKLQPTISIFIDSVPSQLAYRTGQGRTAIVVSSPRPLSEGMLSQLPANSRLFVRTDAQRQAAIAAGVNADHVTPMLPGAVDASQERTADSTATPTIVVLADNRGIEPDDVGLHLGSHQRLWQSARSWIADHVDAYHDDLASEALTQAERSLDLHIQNDDVREGLVDRVRSTLGPQVVAESIITAIAQTDSPIELRGTGWSRHETFNRFASTSVSIDPSTSPQAESPAAALVWLSTAGEPDDRVLDWLAGNRPVIIRQPDGPPVENDAAASWSAIIDIERHVGVFSTRKELVHAIGRFQEDPSPVLAQAAVAREHLLKHHAWRHRLAELLKSVE